MSRRTAVANWKMNVPGEGIDAFCDALSAIGQAPQIIIAPPFVYLHDLYRNGRKGGWTLAGQNCSDKASGALTGEVSAAMLRDCGATHVIVGHSERRALFGEDDSLIGRKLQAAVDAGMTPLLCIGEDEQTREKGETATLLRRQITTAFAALRAIPAMLVAYEPVWAVGTGRNASPEMVRDTHGEIRRVLSESAGGHLPILYGGSVTAENAAGLAAVPEVSGFLVGGASLESSKFLQICQALG